MPVVATVASYSGYQSIAGHTDNWEYSLITGYDNQMAKVGSHQSAHKLPWYSYLPMNYTMSAAFLRTWLSLDTQAAALEYGVLAY